MIVHGGGGMEPVQTFLTLIVEFSILQQVRY
jgi:hypothetical protein